MKDEIILNEVDSQQNKQPKTNYMENWILVILNFINRVQIRIKLLVNSNEKYKSFILDIKNFMLGFFIGCALNIFGFSILRKAKHNSAKQKGFLVGCLLSFVLYVLFSFTVVRYINQEARNKKIYLSAHKNSLKGYKPVGYKNYIKLIASEKLNNLKKIVLFWKKEPVKKSSKEIQREKEISIMKRKRINTINQLRNSFRKKYGR